MFIEKEGLGSLSSYLSLSPSIQTTTNQAIILNIIQNLIELGMAYSSIIIIIELLPPSLLSAKGIDHTLSLLLDLFIQMESTQTEQQQSFIYTVLQFIVCQSSQNGTIIFTIIIIMILLAISKEEMNVQHLLDQFHTLLQMNNSLFFPIILDCLFSICNINGNSSTFHSFYYNHIHH